MTVRTRRSHRLPVAIALSVFFVLAAVCPAAAQQLAYVSATLDDTFCQSPFRTSGCTRGLISVVNTATNQVQTSIDVWRGADVGGLTFGTLLVNPAGDRLYAVLTTAGSSHPLSPSFTSVRVFDTLTLSQIAEFTLNGITRSCTWSPDGARLFCARNVLASDVAVIDTNTHSQAATIAASFPTSVVMSSDGHRLYIAHNDSRVTVHDGATYALLTTVPLPATALALEVTPDGAHLYAALNNQSVADIDTTTDTVAGVIPGVATGSNLPLDIAFAGGNAYVPTGGGRFFENVTVIDVASRTIETTIPVINPLEVATSLDERRVFVSREFALSAIDTSTNQVVASISLPDGPGQLALSPPAPFAGIVIDAPSQGAALGQPFVFEGWAVDVFGYGGGPGIDAVHVWAFPASGASPVFVGAAEYGRPRSDIATLFGPTYLNSGYQMIVRGLTPGAYTLTAFGHSTRTGTFSVARQLSVTVASSVQMAVDAPAQGATVFASFVVAGWALDGAAITGSGIDAVHIWAYPSSGAAPSFAGAATLGHSRPDVAAAFGPQFATAGYALAVENLAPGSYTLIVYARQASTGTFAVQRAVPVTVTAPQPFIFIDVPAEDATDPFFTPPLGTDVRVAGWAIELGAATGTGVDTVHVWAYPTSGAAPLFVGVAAYGGVRPDVGAIFGSRYTESGFNLTGFLPPGEYDVVAFAHSTTTNSFNGVQLIRVEVVQP
jgi:hypothetical protein